MRSLYLDEKVCQSSYQIYSVWSDYILTYHSHRQYLPVVRMELSVSGDQKKLALKALRPYLLRSLVLKIKSQKRRNGSSRIKS